MDRWAFHRAVAAINAAIAFEGPEDDSTALAVVEPLTRIGRHRFSLDVSAIGTGDRVLKFHQAYCVER